MIAAGSIRILSGSGAAWRAQVAETGTTTEGGRDKRAHIALRSVGCFCWAFRRLAHIAPSGGNVRHSLKPLYLRDLSHIAEPRHDR